MNKEFIHYEQALALKELGFDEPCFGWFTNSYLRIGSVVENKHVQGEDETLAPLYQQAFRWFREKHDLAFLIINCADTNKPKEYEIQIFTGTGMIIDKWHSTYEKAELACLITLIEIVKNK